MAEFGLGLDIEVRGETKECIVLVKKRCKMRQERGQSKEKKQRCKKKNQITFSAFSH